MTTADPSSTQPTSKPTPDSSTSGTAADPTSADPASAEPPVGVAPTGSPYGPPFVDRRRKPRLWQVDGSRVLTLAMGVAGGLVLAELSQGIVVRLRGLLTVLIVSLFVSFGIEPAVKWLNDRGISRGLGTGMVFLLMGTLMAGFFAAMAPLVVDQVTNLVENGESLLEGLATQARRLPGEAGDSVAAWLEMQRTELPSRLPEIAPAVGREALGLGQSLLSSIVQVLTALLVTFYLVADGPKLRRALSGRMEPSSQREFLTVWELAVEKTGGYLYSRVLTAIASAGFHTIVFTIVGVPYAVALGIWVGVVSSVIPVVGTYLAGALPLVIALASSPGDAVAVLVAITVYQQIENYLVAPRITKHTLHLHPAIAFVSVLIGAALLGGPGALLALPATAIVSALITAYGERHEVVVHGLTEDTDGDREAARSTSKAERRQRRDDPEQETT